MPSLPQGIKLNELLAAPLVEAMRQELEAKLAEKNAEVARRETQLRQEEQSAAAARQQIDAHIEEDIRCERHSRKFVNMAGVNQSVVDPPSKYLIYKFQRCDQFSERSSRIDSNEDELEKHAGLRTPRSEFPI